MNATSVNKRQWALGIAAAIVIGLALYFAGRWQERSRAEVRSDELKARISAVEAERNQATAALVAAQTQIGLLRARSLLFETVLDLERRNFGTANTRLAAAAQQLAAVSADTVAVRLTGLEELREAIARSDLRVAADVAGQRARVLGFIEQLDQLLTPGGDSSSVR